MKLNSSVLFRPLDSHHETTVVYFCDVDADICNSLNLRLLVLPKLTKFVFQG